jgi:trimethylamine--corrinoid protein Co-methyltransferase
VIDDEMCGAMLRVAKGFKTGQEELAANVIKEVGIGGQFLSHRHTLKHAKAERWYPSLYKRMKKTETRWSLEAIGPNDLAVTAKNKVDEILKTHKAEPLSNETQRAIRDIVTRAEKQPVSA